MGERRAELEAAFDEQMDEDTVTLTNKEDGTPDADLEENSKGLEGKGEPKPQGEETAEIEADGSGKEKKEKSGDKAGAGKEAGSPKEKTDDSLARAAKAAAGSDGTRAPVSWKQGAKAQWDKLPLDVKQDVIRREKEIQTFMSQNAHHKKFTQDFYDTVKPYAHLIQGQGSTPLAAVNNLMKTAAGLTVGNPQNKAAIVAEIIGNYNVDIKILDEILSSGGVQHQNGAGAIPPQIAQALAPVMGFMNEINQAKNQRQQRMEQEAVQQVEEASDIPYFEELREDMADLLDIAAKRGIAMTLEQAYDKAAAMNPEIKSALEREIASREARKNGGTRVPNKRRAANTLAGAPMGNGDAGKIGGSRREQLAAAWEDAN